MRVLISPSTPFPISLQLALDHALHLSPKKQDTLLLYPCSRGIVIGKNQCPFQETDCTREKGNIWRRWTGGGTVVHEEGGACYSFHSTQLQRDRVSRAIVNALRNALPPPAKANVSSNERHDILYQGLKVSGAAFKVSQGKSYHHGTMLLKNSNLDTIRKALVNPKKVNISSIGVPSVPASITRIPDINYAEFCSAMVRSFEDEFQTEPHIEQVLEGAFDKDVYKLNSQVQQYDWTYGMSPTFRVELKYDFVWTAVTIDIECRKSVITNITCWASDANLCRALQIYANRLHGLRYTQISTITLGIEYSDINEWIIANTG